MKIHQIRTFFNLQSLAISPVPTQKGAHPNFSWTGCEWPGVRSLTVYFRVFRNNSEVASGFTTEAWTDEDVIIHGGGDELTYYVKAYLSDSPDSDPSNSVVINGRMAKKLPGEELPTSDEEKSTSETRNIAEFALKISLSIEPEVTCLGTN